VETADEARRLRLEGGGLGGRQTGIAAHRQGCAPDRTDTAARQEVFQRIGLVRRNHSGRRGLAENGLETGHMPSLLLSATHPGPKRVQVSVLARQHKPELGVIPVSPEKERSRHVSARREP